MTSTTARTFTASKPFAMKVLPIAVVDGLVTKGGNPAANVVAELVNKPGVVSGFSVAGRALAAVREHLVEGVETTLLFVRKGPFLDCVGMPQRREAKTA